MQPSSLVPFRFRFLLLLVVAVLVGTGVVRGAKPLVTDFVDPDYIVTGNFGKNTAAAQATIVDLAKEFAAEGPWSVMNKSVTPPTGDKHDYMSWAPYWWPDCSKAGNTTELTPEQVWKTCRYYYRDGKFNPDGRFVNDVGAFQSLADAVLYNAIAHSLEADSKSSSAFCQSAVTFIKVWFLDEETRMNPNLNYGQMQRGPDGQTGSHTGVLDLKDFVKIVSGILILRKKNCADWTPELDHKMTEWTTEYVSWLETASIAIEEANAANNHGSFYFVQLAALKLLVNDSAGALNVTKTYFKTLYMKQIVASGEQPLEAARTRPYHYRAYNLAAMITVARIAEYAGDPHAWKTKTAEGATIQTALEYAMTIPASRSNEMAYVLELFPCIAAVGATYGDPNGKYAAFLKEGEPQYAAEAHFLWNQPLAGGETTDDNTSSKSTAKEDGSNAVSGAVHARIPRALLGLLVLLVPVVG